MSDESPAATPDASRRSPVRTIAVVVVLLALEAVAILGLMNMFRPPSEAMAVPEAEGLADQGAEIVEIEVLKDKLANDRSGLVYIYPAEIFVHVRARNADRVKAEIERFRNEIRADVLAIWRTAEPRHLQEPRLDHLTRRINDLLNRRFELDETSEEPVVIKSVIICGTGFRVG